MLPKHLQVLSKAQLESLCVSCGACCYGQINVAKGMNVVVPDLRCKYLNIKDNGESFCTTYNTRHEVAKSWCNDLESAIDKGLFPKLCPYVKDMPSYTGAVVLDGNQYAKLQPALQSEILSKGKPEWSSDQGWSDFVKSNTTSEKR